MQDDLRTAFQKMFGIEKAHDFQIEVAEHLLINRKSVILQAPTGSGKTWTALFPFLHTWQTGLPFPRKCLYAVPLRVLATQFKEDAARITKDWTDVPKIFLQTGEQQDDRTLEGDLIFTTIDQVLSSALGVPYSLGRRSANINAGAVLSSYLVCDELHLFPVDETKGRGALATLLELLHTFSETTPFLLMTATLSETMLLKLRDQLGAELVKVKEKDLPKIESQQKVRRYHVVDAEIDAAAVLAQHRKRSIVICNQVDRAIQRYDEICQAVQTDSEHSDKTNVILLHSRFIRQHRQEKEDTIRTRLGKRDKKAPFNDSLIVVSTQAIEVGLDITCERLHTELAPANAIIQRAGRCARYKDDEGDVQIYRLPEDPKQSHLPYDATRCVATWEAFSAPHYNGKALTFRDEQEIVTRVHNSADARLLTIIKQDSYQRWEDISAAMFRGDRTGRPRLIREVDSRTVLIHHSPEKIQQPYAWRGFSLYHGTLRGWVVRLQKTEEALPEWNLRYPVPVERDSDGEESHKRTTYDWCNYVHESEQVDLSTIFVIHPDLVSYDRRRGFRLLNIESPGLVDIADICQEPPLRSNERRFLTRYTLESYAEHIRKMHTYYRASKLERQIQLTGERLAHSYGLSAEQFERAALLAIALHDVGKLQEEWQAWSHAYQQEIGESQSKEKMIVHTHYKPDEHSHHKLAEEKVGQQLPRPHHAAEGAYASWPIILQALDGDEWLSQTVFTAIARHHSPLVNDFNPYRLHPSSASAITEALDLIGVPNNLAKITKMHGKPARKDGALEDQLIVVDNPVQWLVYMLIVRTLRLCDGHALEGEE